MEKIYMEESKKQKKSVMNLSVALSFVVSVFAVFSLALYGIVMNQGTGISYAADDQEDGFTITTKTYMGYATDNIPEGGAPGMDVARMQVNNYYKSNDVKLSNQAFCIERRKNTVAGTQYGTTDTVRTNMKDVKTDPGLIYLLGLGKSGKAITNQGAAVDGYVLQTAIWYYLSVKTSSDGVAGSAYLINTEDTLDGSGAKFNDLTVINSNTIYIKEVGTSSSYIKVEGFSAKVKELYNNATKATTPTVSVNVADGESTKTEDEKYYQSPLITVVGNPAASFTDYSVAITGLDDMVVVNENGQEIDKSSITAGTKFYVRIPAEKVTDESKTIQINVTANFAAGSAKYNYAKGADGSENADLQRLATVYPKPVSSGAEFVVTPGTGMNVTQTIYFVGLIVLLCGVGIVYANAKPVEAKQ